MRGIQDVGTSAIDLELNFTLRQVVHTFFSTPPLKKNFEIQKQWPKINFSNQ